MYGAGSRKQRGTSTSTLRRNASFPSTVQTRQLRRSKHGLSVLSLLYVCLGPTASARLSRVRACVCCVCASLSCSALGLVWFVCVWSVGLCLCVCVCVSLSCLFVCLGFSCALVSECVCVLPGAELEDAVGRHVLVPALLPRTVGQQHLLLHRRVPPVHLHPVAPPQAAAHGSRAGLARVALGLRRLTLLPKDLARSDTTLVSHNRAASRSDMERTMK